MTEFISRDLKATLSWLMPPMREGYDAATVAMETFGRLMRELNDPVIGSDEAAAARKRSAAELQLELLRSECRKITSALHLINAPAPAALMKEVCEALEYVSPESHVDPEIQSLLSVISSGAVTAKMYCELLAHGHVDAPVVMLDAINAIRSKRNVAPIEIADIITSTMALDIGPAPGKLDKVDAKKAKEAYPKLLAAFRAGTGKFIDDGDVAGAGDLLKVLSILRTMMRNDTLGSYFWLLEAAVEVAAAKAKNIDSGFVQLAFLADDVISMLELDGERAALDLVTRQRMLAICHFLAIEGAGTPLAQAVDARFKITESLPSEEEIARFRNQMAGGDIAVSTAVLPQILVDIEQMTLALDKAFKEQGVRAVRQLHHALHLIPQISNTLKLCGFPEWGERLDQQAELLGQQRDTPHKLTEQDRAQVVEHIIYVERQAKMRLVGISADAPDAERLLFDHEVVKRLLQETLTEISTIKHRLSVYIASGTERDELIDGTEQLRQVARALSLYKIDDVHSVLNALVSVIRKTIAAVGHLPEEVVASIADVVTGVEEYLVCKEQEVTPHAIFMETARKGLLALGVNNPDDVEIIEIAPVAAGSHASGVDITAGEFDLAAIDSFREDVEASILMAEDAFSELTVDNRDAAGDIREAFSAIEGNARIIRQDALGDVAAALQDVASEAGTASEEEFAALREMLHEGLSEIRAILPNPMAFKAEQAMKALHERLAAALDARVSATPPRESEAPGSDSRGGKKQPPLPPTATGMDPKLLQLYKQEFARYYEPLRRYVDSARDNPATAEIGDDLLIGLHSIAGSSRSAGFHDVGHVFKAVELCWEAYRHRGHVPDDTALTVLDDVLNETARAVDQFDEVTVLARKDELITTVDNLYQQFSQEQESQGAPKKKRRRRRRRKPSDVAAPEDFHLAPDSSVDDDEESDALVEAEQAPEPAVDRPLMSSPVFMTAPEPAAESSIPVEPPAAPAKTGHRSEAADAICEAVDMAKVDADVLEIFEEEAQEVLEELRPLIAQWKDESYSLDLAAQVRRGFHTLKGSSRMALAQNPVADLAWSYERLLNNVADKRIDISPAIIDACERAIQFVPSVIATLKGEPVPVADLLNLVNQARTLCGLPVIGNEPSPVIEPQVDMSVSVPIVMDVLEEQPPIMMEVIADHVVTDEPRKAPEETEVEPDDYAVEEISFDECLPQEDVAAPSPGTADHPVVIPNAELSAEGESTPEYDEEMLSLFLDDCDVEIPKIERYMDAWQETPAAPADIGTLKRHMHTLKGSSRLAGIEVIGTLTHEAESVLEAVSKGVIKPVPDLYTLMRLVFDAVTTMVDEARARQPVTAAPELTNALAHAVDFHEVVLPGRPPADASIELADDIANIVEPVPPLPIEVEDVPVERAAEGDAVTPVETVAGDAEYDGEMLSLFLDDCDVEVPKIERYMDAWQETPAAPADIGTLKRHMHTLKGSSRLAGIEVIGTLTHEAESVLEAVSKGVIKPVPDLYTLMRLVFDAVTTMVDEARARQPVTAAPELTNALAHAVDFHEVMLPGGIASAMPDNEPATITEEAPPSVEAILDDQATAIEDILDGWATNPEDERPLPAVVSALRAIAAVSAPVADVAAKACDVFERLADGRIAFSPDAFTLAVYVSDAVNAALKALRKGTPDVPNENLVAVLQRTMAGGAVDLEPISGKPKEAAPQPDASAAIPSQPAEPADVSPELRASFVEEAKNIMDMLSGLVDDWVETVRDEEKVAKLKRHMHTLKGLARIVGLGGLSDLTHEMETAYDRIAAGKVDVAGVEAIMVSAHDALTDGLRSYIDDGSTMDVSEHTHSVRVLQPVGKKPVELKAVPTPPPAQKKAAPPPTTKAPQQPALAVVHDISTVRGVIDAKRASRAATHVPAKPGSQDGDTLRIDVGLLGDVIRQASELSALRFKLRAQYNVLGLHERDIQDGADKALSLIEMLEPLLQQYSDRMAAEIGVDPMELDRFSEIRTLSVVLSDVLSNVRGSVTALLENSDHLSGLIAEQSALTKDLYADVLTARLVPFKNITARLKKVVRQTSSELGKPINVVIEGESESLDKNLVDNLAAPMEHILRNSCDHGIESADVRRATGKPEAGTVRITVHKSAAEAIIEVKDDGGGIKTDIIRKKAIEKGLMHANDQPTEREIMQFIMHAGFSTAEKVSQISGRGVGMDVVKTTIQELGGTIEIESERGKSTTFRIRVPVAIGATRVVFVRTGQTVFAIPSSIVDRVEYKEREYFGQAERSIRSKDVAYKHIHLADLTGMTDNRQSHRHALTPVFLCRVAGVALAIEVDEALGMPEVAVKPLPPIIQSIQGVFGSTETVDGSPVLVLDLASLVRHNLASKGAGFEVRKNRIRLTRQAQRPLAIVVDDSVAMRKAASAVLYAMGFDVMTAIDGVAGLELLKDNRLPSIVLVDVEMPRMDGFELTRAIRRVPHLKTVPVVMITSRSGDEHREHAADVGVSRFLSKPIRPPELQAVVAEIVKDNRIRVTEVAGA